MVKEIIIIIICSALFRNLRFLGIPRKRSAFCKKRRFLKSTENNCERSELSGLFNGMDFLSLYIYIYNNNNNNNNNICFPVTTRVEEMKDKV